ncbi:MAG: alpha/beta family hydrolase [Thermoplasmata archaeon]
MRDDDKLLSEPGLSFGSGIVGACDVCGERQAVIILQKERFKLCVLDFLNKTWITSKPTPGAPLPLYRSDRVVFDTDHSPSGKAQAVVLTPTKQVRHPVVLITPDVYGLTTQLLDAAVRFAREGFEVLLPDIGTVNSIGAGNHLAMRIGVRRGGVPMHSTRVQGMVDLYQDAMQCLKARPMVDPDKAAVFGASYGGSLAIAYAGQTHGLSAILLAYPAPVAPFEYLGLLTGPVLLVSGGRDRLARRCREELVKAEQKFPINVEHFFLPYGRHDFLARDKSSYDLTLAEMAWAKMGEFLKARLFPPPPKPPSPPRAAVAAPSPGPSAKSVVATPGVAATPARPA